MVIEQLQDNNVVFNVRLNNIKSTKVKIFLIKWFNKMKSKLKKKSLRKYK